MTHRAHRLCTLLLLALVARPVLAQPDGSFTLNLKNTDIHSLIETVSKQTRRNFVVDPRVKAKITVISSHEMSSAELYEVFLSVLQVHGYAAVPSGDIIKIVPDVNAKQGAVPMLQRNDQNDQLVTHVIQVQNVPAAQLVPILRPLVPQQGHLAAYAATNALIITDRSANIARMVRIVRRIDLPDNEEIEVVQLQHASAAEVVRILGTLTTAAAAKGAAATPGAPKLASDERTNSVLISGDKAGRLRMRGLIAHLDTPLDRGGNTRVIYLRYANAKDLVAILKGVQESQAKQEGKGKPDTGVANQIDIQADEHTNALVVTGPPDALRNLQTVISQLDIRRAQVLVEAIIAEVSQTNSRQLGVSWVLDGSSNDSPVGFVNLGGTVNSALGAAAGVIPDGTQFGAGVFSHDSGDPGINFALLLRALAADADNNILSTPSLVTLDNQEAQIIVGQNVPFVTGQFTNTGSGSTTTSTNPFQTIERQDIGITLKVKPQINEGNTIKLEIEQEVSSLASSSASASDLITTKRSIQTTVLIDDGQTLVLGGLIDDSLRDRQEKVPLLGDIPILGRLFQYRSTEKIKQNLMVFLHPLILRDVQAGNAYTGEKYNYLRAQQMVADERGIGLLPDETPLLPELEVFLRGPSRAQTTGRSTSGDK